MSTPFPRITPPLPDSWLAVNYSLVFPGLGQLYSHHWIKGSLLVVSTLALLSYGAWAVFSPPGNTVMGFWSLGVLLVVYSFSILDAYRGTQPGYANRISVPKGRQDPWYAVFLSQILPGLGHLYCQQAALGGGLLLIGILTVWLANIQPTLVPIPPLVWAWSCYHVYQTFPNSSRTAKQRSKGRAIALLVLGLFLMRLVLGLTPGWVQQTVEQLIVTSESMEPTLAVGDRLFVRRDAPYQPTVGDIVAFSPPPAAIAAVPQTRQDLLLVKRILGLPGQTVEVVDGQLYINHYPLSEDYLKAAPNYQWGPATIPPDSYFVLGDNRNNSADSHLWGYVPRAHLLGAAYKIYWPPERIQPLANPGRSAGG